MTTQTLSLSRSRAESGPVARDHTPAGGSAADRRCLRGIRAGDESAFTQFAGRHHRQMLRVARCYVGCAAAAEEVTLESWSAALRDLERVDERTSPRLWLFRILTESAKLRSRREGSSLEREDDDAPWPAPGMDWPASPRTAWDAADRRRLRLLREQGAIDEMIAELPLGERLVVTLRDVCRWDAAEVAELLAISPATERALLDGGRRRLHTGLAARLRPVAA